MSDQIPAVAVLRDIWAGKGATEADFDECLPTGNKPCKATAELGIQGMNDPATAAVQQAEWRRQMAAEGKTPLNARSIGKEFADKIQEAPHA
jgi:hypothetical protein